MQDILKAPPVAPALIESLRGVGYSTESAVADVVDNSVSSGAKRIWVDFDWNAGNPQVSIRDDGRGLDEAELFLAMQLGSRDPSLAREPSDLGRFGLGLKTASFSQCRLLTVASKKHGDVFALRWDLDHVRNVARDWEILRGFGASELRLRRLLEGVEHGTLVSWELTDRLVGGLKNGTSTKEAFLETAERVAHHLSMVFHRFLDESDALRLYFNGGEDRNRLKPWDPFMSSHPATIRRPSTRFGGDSDGVNVQAFILPHKDRLTQKEWEAGAGRHGWTAHQGFYVYRGKRLLVPGSWLGLGSGGKAWTRDEVYKLARIRLDISNASDFAWDIDIRKSVARPPEALRPKLRALATDARDVARSVFAYRGGERNRGAAPDWQNLWLTRRQNGAIYYEIDREHPAVLRAIQSSNSSSDVDELLMLIQATIPVQRIWLDTAADEAEVRVKEAAGASEAMRAVVLGLWKYLHVTLGLSAEQVQARLLRTEPFHDYPELIAEIATTSTGSDS